MIRATVLGGLSGCMEQRQAGFSKAPGRALLLAPLHTCCSVRRMHGGTFSSLMLDECHRLFLLSCEKPPHSSISKLRNTHPRRDKPGHDSGWDSGHPLRDVCFKAHAERIGACYFLFGVDNDRDAAVKELLETTLPDCDALPHNLTTVWVFSPSIGSQFAPRILVLH